MKRYLKPIDPKQGALLRCFPCRYRDQKLFFLEGDTPAAPAATHWIVSVWGKNSEVAPCMTPVCDACAQGIVKAGAAIAPED